MARVLITGSSSGLGLMAGQLLLDEGHEVVLHARTPERAPDIAPAVIGDVTTLTAVRSVAEQAAALGPYDAVIHNVGVYLEPRRVTEDGVEHVFAVNVLAPYLLTALLPRPARLVYLTSGLHRGGSTDLDDLRWERRRWSSSQAYADSKLWDVVLAFAVARRWPDVASNTADPGWVPTRMGGPHASDDLSQGHVTQVRLALGDIPGTAGYYYHQTRSDPHPAATDPAVQEALLARCAELTGTELP